MRHLARQTLNVLMVAVLLAAGGLNGYGAALAAFDKHEHGVHGLHDHAPHSHAGDHDHGDTSDVANLNVADATPSGGDPAADCGLCSHVHVHSCCVYAVPAADLGLKLGLTRSAAPVAISHIPPGQLTTPLFRPPRVTA